MNLQQVFNETEMEWLEQTTSPQHDSNDLELLREIGEAVGIPDLANASDGMGMPRVRFQDPEDGGRVCFLNLSGKKKVEEMPEAIFRLTALEKLHLYQWESLKYVSPDIQKLQKLNHLSLSGCSSLEYLPREILELSKLQTWHMWNCHSLRALPEGGEEDDFQSQWSKLSNVRRLVLTNCSSLQYLPRGMLALQKLEVLHLSECKSLKMLLEGDDRWEQFSSLTHLSLKGCTALERIPNSLWKLPSIKNLDLSNVNCLTELPTAVGSLTSLVGLNVSETPIKQSTMSMRQLCDLPKLNRLSLRDCPNLPEDLQYSNDTLEDLKLLVNTQDRIPLLELAVWKEQGWSELPQERAKNRVACSGIDIVIQNTIPFLCNHPNMLLLQQQ